jgi:hypothetical protein
MAVPMLELVPVSAAVPTSEPELVSVAALTLELELVSVAVLTPGLVLASVAATTHHLQTEVTTQATIIASAPSSVSQHSTIVSPRSTNKYQTLYPTSSTIWTLPVST